MREAAQVVAVEDQVAGDELLIAATSGTKLLTLTDATHFNETGGGTLELDDTNGTVTVLAYASADLEANTITMSANLAATWPIGTQVRVSPHEITRVAYVQPLDGDDDGELVTARVPFTMRDRVEVSEREGGLGEIVEMERVGYTFVIADVLGSLPIIDADSLPIDDIADALPPPQVTDGIPPASSPVALVTGALGAIIVQWVPVTNNDPVTYEVHISTSAGFTPTAGDVATLAAEVNGTMLWIRETPDGEPLVYGTTYYARIIATDPDPGAAAPGTVGAGTPLKVEHPDLAVDSVWANNVLAKQITADKLEAFLVLASTIKTAEAGQRVEIAQNGITMYDASGVPIVVLPTGEGYPFFRADIEAIGIDVLNRFTLRGAGVMEPGSTLTLKNAQSDPATSPTMLAVWDTLSLSGNSGTPEGIDYDANGGAAGTTPCFWVSNSDDAFEMNASTGTVNRLITDVPNDHNIKGITRIGTNVFILTFRPAANRFYIRKYLQSTLAFVSSTDITSNMPISLMFRPALGNDGTNLIVVGPAVDSPGTDGDTVVRLRAYNPTTMAFVSNTDLTGLTIEGYYGPNFYGYEKVTEGGSAYHFVAYQLTGGFGGYGVFPFLVSSSAYQANMFFPSSGVPRGIAHDGTQFWTHVTALSLTKHTNWTWTTESASYWGAYTWVQDNGAASAGTRPLGAGDFETKKSPTANVVMPRRAKLRFTTPDLPGGITHAGVYIDRGASEPALDFITDTATKSLDRVGFTAGGAGPPANTSFVGGGSGAALRTQGGEILLRASGIPRCKVKNGAGQSLTSGTEAVVPVLSVDADTDGFWNSGTAPQYVILPFDGQYEVLCQLSFAVDGNNRRTVRLQRAPSPYTTWTNIIDDAYAGAQAYPNDRTTVQIAAMIEGTAGDGIRVRGYQNSGGNLVATMRMTLLYSGPT